MKLSEIPKDELELMGYDDIAYIILQEKGKKMKLADIFNVVGEVLDLPSETIDNQLMDFFELMSTNKKFTMLKNGYWDLQSRHKANIVIEDNDEDEEEIVDELELNEMDNMDEEDNDLYYDKDDENDDVVDDDLADLMIVDGDEESLE